MVRGGMYKRFGFINPQIKPFKKQKINEDILRVEFKLY